MFLGWPGLSEAPRGIGIDFFSRIAAAQGLEERRTGDRGLVRDFVLPPVLRCLGWAATLVMLAAAIAMIATLGRG